MTSTASRPDGPRPLCGGTGRPCPYTPFCGQPGAHYRAPCVAGQQTNAAPDQINPSHYQGGKIETIDKIADALGPEGLVAFCAGNAIKYLDRAGLKGDDAETVATDFAKAAWYCQMAAHTVNPQRHADPRTRRTRT
jgi:hypothetical protein